MKFLSKTDQVTPYSCALACIESILLAAGVDYSQSKMLDDLIGEFPDWTEHPGKIAPADFPRIFEAAGISVEMLIPGTTSETRELISDSLGGIVSRAKCWRTIGSDLALVDNWHAVRLLEMRPLDLVVMNPGFPPVLSAIESWHIDDIESLQALVYIFKRKAQEQ